MTEKDVFVNQAYITVVESAANTLTFAKLETGVTIHEKIGWIISRLDYSMGLAAANFGAEGDVVEFGISTSDLITTISLRTSAIVDYNAIRRNDFGTAASGMLTRQPFQKTFANLPGGGILVPPNPIYIYVKGGALTSAMTIECRLFYTYKELKLEEFWELVELRRMIGT